MYGVRVEYHTEDQDGEVRKRVETLVLAIQNGERVITVPKVTIVGDPAFCAPTNGSPNVSLSINNLHGHQAVVVG